MDANAQARYFEDFPIGYAFDGGPIAVTPEAVHAFASTYDPQPFHLDPDAAAASVFRGLTTSGWHTAALGMRMLVDSRTFAATGALGLGVDALRWTKAVRPGDVLRMRCEVVGSQPSASGARGTVHLAMRIVNHHDEVVLTQTAILLIPARPRSAAAD